jgi:hypothetical protein
VSPEFLVLCPRNSDTDFSNRDYAISLVYNFLLWLAAVLQYHFMHLALAGGSIARSLKSFTISWLAFASLALVYMNHFVEKMQPFFLWSIIDAALVFAIVALANGLLHPRFFPPRDRSKSAVDPTT